MYYIAFDDFALCGSSPEPLITVQGDSVETRPIAGTRKRGADAAEDRRLVADLRADEKERAEHVMLVDLGRNDLGRVCAPGTVRVDELMNIELYSHVIHMVSSVRGTLADGATPMDALKAGFPAGTVSGAPKVRAMQIIDELETVRRGPYAGAIGYLSYGGDLDTCICIRTVVVKDGVAHVQAGAGIVADSDPAREYEETQNKAAALLRAIELAHEEFSSMTTPVDLDPAPREPILPAPRVFMIDNYDSFTYNLVQYLGELGAEITVERNDQVTLDEIAAAQPTHLVVSPGPCTPNEAGISMDAIARFGAERLPVLGVCLGHQAIGQVYGGVVRRAGAPVHGKTDEIGHDGRGVFAGLPDPFTATRYHSLVVDEALPDVLELSAWNADGIVMGVRHRELPVARRAVPPRERAHGRRPRPAAQLPPDGRRARPAPRRRCGGARCRMTC